VFVVVVVVVVELVAVVVDVVVTVINHHPQHCQYTNCLISNDQNIVGRSHRMCYGTLKEVNSSDGHSLHIWYRVPEFELLEV